MSRAFINEDAQGEQEPRFVLPDPDDPGFPDAAAWALLEGADMGYSLAAERATGYRWGEPALVPHVEAILAQAEELVEERLQQLARRFLRNAKRKTT